MAGVSLVYLAVIFLLVLTQVQTSHLIKHPDIDTNGPGVENTRNFVTKPITSTLGDSLKRLPVKIGVFEKMISQKVNHLRKRAMPAIYRGPGVVDYRWTHNLIPYEFEENTFSSSERGDIERAMDIWAKYTCLKFSPANTGDRIRFQNGRLCNSAMGMSGGVQPVNLHPDCRSSAATLHELGHAMGLIHEHKRPDRDKYIRILEDNVDPVHRHNFDKVPWNSVQDMNISYDYLSIMHYWDEAFSKNGEKVMKAVDKSFQNRMGREDTLSFKDIKTINLLYECKKTTDGCQQTDDECPGEGFVGKDCRCWCPGDPYVICGTEKRNDGDGKRNKNGDESRNEKDKGYINKERENKKEEKSKKKPNEQKSQKKGNKNKNNFKNKSGKNKVNVKVKRCSDMYRRCTHWLTMNYNKCSPFMKKICRKTCGICTVWMY